MKRSDKIQNIRDAYQAAMHKKKPHDEAIVYSVEQNRDCTSDEFVFGIYPLHALSLPVEKPAKQKEFFGKVRYLGGKELWRLDKHNIALSPDWPDHRIISVIRQIKTIDGELRTFRAQGFAVGQDALNAIDPRKRVKRGIDKEIADYEAKARDRNLERRLKEAARKRAREIQ